MSLINFNDYFYDNYEELHKRFIIKNNSLGKILEIFTKLQISLRDFTKPINNIVIKDYPLFPEQNSTQYEALEYIKFILTILTTQYNVEIELIKNQILVPIKEKKEENFKKEKELYLELKKINAKYNDSLVILQKSKEKFYQTANIAEMSTKSVKEISLRKLNNDIDKEQQNLYNLLEQKSIEALNEAKKNDEIYIKLLKEANTNRENNIKKQYEFLQFYGEMEYNDFKLYKSVLLDYLCNLKTKNSIIKGNLMEMEEKINQMNIDKDIKLLITKYKTDKKPEAVINYHPYVPKIDSKDCFKDDSYKLYYGIIVAMKSYINILPDFDIKKETKKEELRELSKIFFSLNINYNESVKEGILKLLQEEWIHEFFLVILSKQRTNGRYCRTKKVILDLAEILNLIIDICYKSLNYMTVKTCIILSQTFYYEEKQKKIYLFNYLIKNRWVRMPTFWRDIIDVMIANEVKKVTEDTHARIKKTSLDNIVFSQSLAYTTSMKDFQIDKRITLKIIDEVINKYELSQEFKELVYNNIGDKKYVEELRNEYKANPDLEQKILEQIKNEENEEKLKKEKEKEKENKENVENNENNQEKNESKEIEDKKNEEKKENNIEDNKIMEKENNNDENKNETNIDKNENIYEKEDNNNPDNNINNEKDNKNEIIKNDDKDNKINENENEDTNKDEKSNNNIENDEKKENQN